MCMKDLKTALRQLIDEHGAYELFSVLEDVAYDKDVQEHKANPMESDYYWPGILGVAKRARESTLELDAKRREFNDKLLS